MTDKIKTCVFDKEYKDKKIYKCETESGKTGQAWEEMKEGQEVTVTEKEYNGKPQYTFYPVKEKKGFPAKDYTFLKRQVALECAVEFSKGTGAKSTDVLKVASYFFTEFLNK
jgi:hypothetical protein